MKIDIELANTEQFRTLFEIAESCIKALVVYAHEGDVINDRGQLARSVIEEVKPKLEAIGIELVVEKRG